MERMTPEVRKALIHVIAKREGTVRQIAEWYGTTPEYLRTFASDNREAIEAAHKRLTEPPEVPTEPTPTQLDDLWISNKFERLKRLQAVAESTYQSIVFDTDGMTPADRATVIREFRSYLMLAANELGQLLHRGSGDGGTGDTLSVNIAGVDMDQLR